MTDPLLKLGITLFGAAVLMGAVFLAVAGALPGHQILSTLFRAFLLVGLAGLACIIFATLLDLWGVE